MKSPVFKGDESALTAVLESIGLVGTWIGSAPREFILVDGPKVRWWPSTGTIFVQGKPDSLVDEVTGRIAAALKAHGNFESKDQHLAVGTVLTLGYEAKGDIQLTIKNIRKL